MEQDLNLRSGHWCKGAWGGVGGASAPVLPSPLFPSLPLTFTRFLLDYLSQLLISSFLCWLFFLPQIRLSPRSVLIFLSLANPTFQKSSDSTLLGLLGIYFQLLDGRFHLDILLDPKSQYFPNHIDHFFCSPLDSSYHFLIILPNFIILKLKALEKALIPFFLFFSSLASSF